MVGSVAVKNVHLFEEYFIKKSRILRTTSPIMLDADNLNAPVQKESGLVRARIKSREEIEEAERDQQEKIMIIRKTFIFISLLISDDMSEHEELHVKNVLEILYNTPGLVANFIFNLNQPHDDDEVVLSHHLNIIGTMCQHLRKFQKSRYMIETGTYNLIYIMTRMGHFEDERTTENDIKFVLKSMEAIRKATSCRVIELLDSFVANNTIEHCVQILKSIGEARLNEIEDIRPEDRTPVENIIRELQINC